MNYLLHTIGIHCLERMEPPCFMFIFFRTLTHRVFIHN